MPRQPCAGAAVLRPAGAAEGGDALAAAFRQRLREDGLEGAALPRPGRNGRPQRRPRIGMDR